MQSSEGKRRLSTFVATFAATFFLTFLVSKPCAGFQRVRLQTIERLDGGLTAESYDEDRERVAEARKSDLERAKDVLKYQDIEPTFEGIHFFLETLSPDHPEHERRRQEAKAWIDQLGAEDFQVRQSSHRALLRMQVLPEAELAVAAKSDDLEKASRASLILKQLQHRDYRNTIVGITEAACVTIAHEKIPGMTEILLETIPRFDELQIQNAIQNAIFATSNEEDIDLILAASESEHDNVRIAALHAIVHMKGEAAKPELLKLMQDPKSLVRLPAARALADMGARESWPTLIELLGDELLEVRLGANRILRASTSQKFEYFAYESSEKRDEAIQRWKNWHDEHGAEAELSFPLSESKVEIGRVLVADYQSGKVFEVDEKGNETWQIRVSNPWGVYGLPNGNRVVAIYNPSAFVVYDAAGTELWRKDELPGNPMGLMGLENGNVVVSCSSANKVIEYRPDGEIAWEVTLEGRPCDAQRLDNGNTLVALINANRVVEVNQAGDVVWQVNDVRQPLTAQRLENGNTLVSLHGTTTAIEYSPAGKNVREFETDAPCSVARRLANGSTLLATQTSIKLVDADGRELWKIDELAYCFGAMPY